MKRGSITAFATLVRLVIMMLRNKLLAVFLGPAGLGLVALITNLIETAAIVAGGGSGDAMNRELARKRPLFSDQEIVSTCVAITGGMLVLVLPAASIAFYALLPDQTFSLPVVAAVSAGVLSATGWRLLSGVMLGHAMARRMAIALLAGSLANLGFSALLLWWGIKDPIAYAALPAMMAFAAGAWFAGKKLAELIESKAFQALPALRPVLLTAVPVTIGFLFEPLIALYLRAKALEQLGASAVGLLQPGLLLVLVAGSVFNSVAGMTIVRWDQSHESAFSTGSKRLLLAAIGIAAIGSALAFALSALWPPIVRMLFSGEFAQGASLIPWFLAGEALRIGGALLLFTYMSRGLGLWTIMPRVAAFLTAMVAVQASEGLNLVTIAHAYAAAFFIYWLISLLMWLMLQFRLRDTTV
jgi:PST family polysaccharide transporter